MTAATLHRYATSRDETAFHELVREHQGMVYSTCLRVLKHPSAEVDEAVQDTFMKLARSAGEVHGNVAAWLNACARTTALDRLRRQRTRTWRERELGQQEECGAASTPGAEHERQDLAAVVWGCIEELPEREREVVTRHYYLRQSQRQIAQALKVSQVTIQQRLVGAHELLRRRCVRRGIAVGALMALLSTSSPAAVPGELAARLARIAPQARHPLAIGGALAGILAVVVTAVMWSASHARAGVQSAAADRSEPIAVAPVPPVPAPATGSKPAETAALAAASSDIPFGGSRWSFTHLDQQDGKVELDGGRVPTMRLKLAGKAEVGLATLATALPAGGYVVDFDYCTLATHCPYSCVTVDPGFDGFDPLTNDARPITNLDSVRSPVGAWRHFRSEWKPQPGDRLRISTWIDGVPFQRVEVPRPGRTQDRLHLRVIMAEVEVARLRVTPLPEAGRR